METLKSAFATVTPVIFVLCLCHFNNTQLKEKNAALFNRAPAVEKTVKVHSLKENIKAYLIAVSH